MQLNQTERRPSMQFVVKSINPRGRVLPKLQEDRFNEPVVMRLSRKDVMSYNPLYLERQAIRVYKKPILFQMNFDYNRTVFPKKYQQKDGRQLRRLQSQSFDKNHLLLITVGNQKCIIRSEQQQISFQQKLSNAIATKSEVIAATPSTVVVDNEPEAVTINFEHTSPPKPEKRKNLQFNNHHNFYKYFVGPGNNGQLVKSVLEARGWVQTCQSNSMFNLKWTQTCQKIRFDHITSEGGHRQLVNHFEFHEEISTKSGLLRNLKALCQREQKQQLFQITPITFQVDFTNENYDYEFKKFINFFLQNHPKRSQIPKAKRKQQDHKAFIDFVKSIKHVHNMQNLTLEKKDHGNSRPIMKPIYVKDDNYLWLLKPVGLNRGRGIYLFRSLEELTSILEEYCQRNEKPAFNIRSPSRRHSSAKEKTTENEPVNPQNNQYIKSDSFVIQKYIERPMLIAGRKYDIRVWVLLTHDMDLYFFKQGYIRTSCEEFSLEKNDLYVHLTNNAVQKFSNNYGSYEKGNQLSFDDIQKIFQELAVEYKEESQTPPQAQPPQPEQPNDAETENLEHSPPTKTYSFREHVLPQMKRMVTLSIQSVKKKINCNDRKYTFEIYGYDFMIDEMMKPWLIEVNTNPCIEQSSPILQKLLPRMLHNAFQLTLDILFPPKPKNSVTCSRIRYPVEGYTDQENMWEQLGSYKIEKKKSRK